MSTNKTVFIEYDCSKILSLSGEKEYIAVNQDLWTILPSLILIVIVGIIFSAISVISYFFLNSLEILVSSLLFVLLIVVSFLTQQFVNWFYHIYIVTSRKLLEITYSPLSGFISNEIFLDQVKCTEVDMNTEGLFFQLLDIGTVTITFDRPTHKQQFVLSSIKNYRQIGLFLTNMLVINPNHQSNKKEQWFEDKSNPQGYRYAEDINVNNQKSRS